MAKLGWTLEDEIYVDDTDKIYKDDIDDIHEIAGHALFRLLVIGKAMPLL